MATTASNPSLVPGILFCNRHVENPNPRLIDIGPTVLSMFGADVPDYMDGKVLVVGDAGAKAPAEREETLAQVVVMSDDIGSPRVNRRTLLKGSAAVAAVGRVRRRD